MRAAGLCTVTILTRNSSRYLREVLAALTGFPEVLLMDSGSTDDTFAIAAEYSNVRICRTIFTGFGQVHNEASELATYDWILSIDSDEVVSPELSREILGLTLDEGCVYTLNRHNHYNGKWIRACGWYPDEPTRLYQRRRTRFTNVAVHEAVIDTGLRKVRLRGPLIHYSYNSVADFITKTQRYSELFAEQHRGKMKSSVFKALRHGLAAFLKNYVVKLGFTAGKEGLLISVTAGYCGFCKYIQLLEANQKLKQSPACQTDLPPTLVPEHIESP